jgi:hypothetical protein
LLGIEIVFRIWAGLAVFGFFFYLASNIFLKYYRKWKNGYQPIEIINVNETDDYGPVDLSESTTSSRHSNRFSFDH